VVGKDVHDAIGFQLALGPAGEIFREAGVQAQQRLAEINAALAKALYPFLSDEGVVMPSSSWVISARNPG
jgi:hypothetical protein